MSASQKQILRHQMKEKRALLFKQNPQAGKQVTDLFFKSFTLSPETLIGGYWPIGSELDIRPLLNQLYEKGFLCALPCLESNGIIYRQWTPLTLLEKKTFHTFEPPPSSPIVLPEVLLVPLLAFDKNCHRLGYGQGHFDRFLHQNTVLTIGVGFKGQEVDRIPYQHHDFALKYVLTEQELIEN